MPSAFVSFPLYLLFSIPSSISSPLPFQPLIAPIVLVCHRDNCPCLSSFLQIRDVDFLSNLRFGYFVHVFQIVINMFCFICFRVTKDVNRSYILKYFLMRVTTICVTIVSWIIVLNSKYGIIIARKLNFW